MEEPGRLQSMGSESDTTERLHFLSLFTLTRQTFVSKVISLLFNMLSRLGHNFSKEQASFNFMAAVFINYQT